MKYLKIQNNGELDIRLISLMGGSTKAGQTLKIGKFGTGLKYTLAYLIRNNIDFKIFIGEKEAKITTVTEHIQGTDFQIIYINGERSSITTMMGSDWKGWMIVREIWCNAIDEGGATKEVTETCFGSGGTTTFFIQAAGEILDTINSWGTYFIEQSPLWENESYAIYPPTEKMRLYKNGVLIYENDKQKTVFSYDIKEANINELREYKGWAVIDIVYLLKELNEKNIEIFMNNLKDEHFEASMDYTFGSAFGEEWKQAIGQAKIISKKDYDVFVSKGINFDEAKMIVLPESLVNQLSHRFPATSSVRRADKVNSFHESFDAEIELQIKSGLAILESCGYEVSPELKFIYGYFGDPAVFARINKDEKTVMFSIELKRMSRFEIVTTIIEENEHFISGFQDETRAFQQHFINLFTKQLLDKNEVLL